MYSTVKAFAGRRATIGSDVLIKTMDAIVPGKVDSIDIDNDAPNIRYTIGFPPLGRIDRAARRWAFYDATSEHSLHDMPAGSWCWPPEV